MPSDGEQIAIVGMACQLPGAPDLDAYWHLLEAGADAVTDGRQDSGPWSGVAGDPAAETASLRRGGFVEGLDRFDARFFGIRPIEARTMDPRQRMLLETSWRALEDAGIDPGPLGGSRAGVYAGLTGGSEYRDLVASSGQDDSYLGTAASVALGRIAYTLGLMGPAVPVDATCASSLVAVHQAVAALRQGEVELALAGGVQTALSPSVAKFMAEFGLLSKTGRCRTFDAAADGFVRGEGCGMVVLKRLRDAEEDGDRIWGVIRGSAVNQNGASAALTVPNGTAQEQLLEGALRQAGLGPSDVDYVEAHGTGSQLGDPIEVRAAAAVYGRDRDADRPLVLGTAKTNIGHLEAAAGIAGLIKVMLAMKRGTIPRHLHFENPNPHLDWSDLPVRVASEAMDWPPLADRPPRAGVSAFAISGTNAHVIVEGYSEPGGGRASDEARPVPEGPPQPVPVELPDSIAESPAAQELRPRQTRLLPLSGKSDTALRELANSYASWLNERTADLPATISAAEPLLSDMAWTASAGRSHFPYRAGVLFDSTESLRDGLEAVAESNGDPGPPTATRVVFAYPDESTQWIGMGAELYECEPVARAVLDFCDGVLQADRGASLLEAMFGNAGDLDDPAWTQPAAFALECALTGLWASVGIQPSAVFGVGAGDMAAARAAGILSLEDGLRLAAARGAAMAVTSSTDGAPPTSLVAALADIAFGPAQVTLVSSATGRMIESSEVQDAGYWSQRSERKLPLERTARTLEQLGADLVIEIGARPELGAALALCWPSASAEGGGPPRVLSSLPQRSCGFLQAVAQSYESGLSINFAGLFAGESRSRVSLPSYPFQRRRFWFNAS
ncbi:MAG: type I polyketide synthase [Bryobacterales bacterium]|nr:type I polyketide synthase [Bryobacterales bacterium]